MNDFDFSTLVDRKGTFCTQWDFVEDRFGKKDLLPFTISDMDFKTAPAILETLTQSIQHGVFGYSRWQVAPFLDAIEHWFLTRFDTKIDQNKIVYGPSVMYIVAKLMLLWSQKNEGVIVFTPAYDAFYKTIESNQRTLIASPLQLKNGTWHCDFDQLESVMRSRQNTLLLLCNPHNPTGKAWTQDELTLIAQLCQKYHIKVISDEIHMDMVWQMRQNPWLNFAKTDWALVTSASKSFNIPALTGAYALISDEKTKVAYLTQLKCNDALSSPSIFAVKATIAAYQSSVHWLDALKQYIFENLIYITERLNQAFPDLHKKVPQATYLDWIDLRKIIHDDAQLQQKLIHQKGVAIMSGLTYGQEGKGFLRLNAACPRQKLERAVEALIAVLQENEDRVL